MYMKEVQFFPVTKVKGFHCQSILSQNDDFDSVASSIASFTFMLNSLQIQTQNLIHEGKNIKKESRYLVKD
jgi:hypothetical protein